MASTSPQKRRRTALALPLILLASLAPCRVHGDLFWHKTRVPLVRELRVVTLERPRFLAAVPPAPPCGPVASQACRPPAERPSGEGDARGGEGGELLRHLQDQLGYETVYSNGTRTLTEVSISGLSPPRGLAPVGLPSVPSRRSRRQVYGTDGRFTISAEAFARRHPFSAAVRLSTGCTGVLVSPRHVLTAAHCLHDGRDYVKGARRLRVGFLKRRRGAGDGRKSDRPKRARGAGRGGRGEGGRRPGRAALDKSGFAWSRVRRTHLPKGWIRAAKPPPQQPLASPPPPPPASGGPGSAMDFDYAVLELRRAHDRRWMEVGVSPPAARLPGRRVHFSGFDDDRSGSLVYRFCPVAEESAELMYQRCDARPGSSGSGVYLRLRDARQRRWTRKVVGVFSGHRWVELGGGGGAGDGRGGAGEGGQVQDFNVAVRITPLKFAQICYWVKGNYADCRDG